MPEKNRETAKSPFHPLSMGKQHNCASQSTSGKDVGYSAESQLVKPSFCPLLLSKSIYTVFQRGLSINMSLRVHS